MEILYLLCSIAATFIRSSFLSLLLAVRSLPLFRSPSLPVPPNPAAVRLYEGRVLHVRRRPVRHSFEYPVRYALFDLDRVAYPSDLSADRAREVAATNGPVLLLTIPSSVGYEQNPLSVYYCYDVVQEQDDEKEEKCPNLKMCIAEVTNTPWGERVLFTFTPGSDLVAKPLHVSPFMDMLGNWSVRADAPGEDLFLAISVHHPTLGNYFTATLNAKSVNSSSTSINPSIFFWLMPHKVAVWIYWQAIQLWWKSVVFLRHPKYVNPKYRADALIRDHELCSRNVAPNGDCSTSTCRGDDRESRTRWCMWRDAQWPWS